MLHIKMFGIQCPSQPTDLEESGSDECEKTFRSFGGFSRSAGRRRNYNFLEALDAAGDENQLSAWEGEQDSSLHIEYGRGNQSLEYDESLHEPPGFQAADLAIHPPAASLVAAFERGLQRARVRAIARGMVLKGKLPGTTFTGEQLMAKPWLGEGHLVAAMREKADDETEQEAAEGGGDDGGGGGGGGTSSGGGGDGDGGDGDREDDDDGGDGDDAAGPPPPPKDSGGESAARIDGEREAANSILDSVLAVDSDSARPKTSAMLTVAREGKKVRVYKRTYLHESQQLDAGKKLPTSRLQKIAAASMQAKQEVERAARRSTGEASSSSTAAPVEDATAATEPVPPQMLGLGKVVVMATCTAAGTYAWWAGRVEKMKCKSTRSSKYVNTTEPALFDEACSAKMKVVNSWYRKHANYEFTYDGPVDDAEYNMENALGMLDLELPDDGGRYRLRDPSQGPQLDAALKLTEVPANQKRSRGEEMLAKQAQVERETMPQPAAKRQRGAPTDRSKAYEAQQAKQ